MTPPGTFTTLWKKQAVAYAEQLKLEGKIVTTEKSGGVYTVRWIDWGPPRASRTVDQSPKIIRGRWRDGSDARLFIRP
jgi:hypothetical protein